MKTIQLTESEIRTLEGFLGANPCSSGCYYSEMQKSKKNCEDCRLTKDMYSMMEKLNLI